MGTPSAQVLAKLYAGDRRGAADVALGHPLDVFASAALGDDHRLQRILRTDPTTVSARTPDGFTALHLAAYFGTADAVAMLLAHGADAGSVAGNPSAVTPLHSAIAHRDPDIVRTLLEAGAPVDAKQAGGFTALHAAALHGQTELVRILIASGADPAVTDDEGNAARSFALKGGHGELAEQLLKS
jgi:ankyrin repeat protein